MSTRVVGDLVTDGQCSGACMVASPDGQAECTCRCKGELHGVLFDVNVDAIEPRATSRRDGIVGSFFHTQKRIECGCLVVQWQGRVLRLADPTTYVLQLFSWWTGEATTQELITLAELREQNAVFYDTSSEMNFAYEHSAGVVSECIHERERWTA